MVFVRNRLIIGVDRNAPHVIVESKDNVSIIDVINQVCNKNGLNLKNIDITEIANGKIVAKAYFPYHSNKLLLDYFILEVKKEEGILAAYLILTKDMPSNYEGPHESWFV